MSLQTERTPKELIQDELVFFREWIGNPLRTGALSPSSRKLARAMAAEIDPDTTGAVLELGPGTGVFTKALLDHGIAEERLVLVEANRDFARMLGRRFPKARIVCGDAYAIDRHLDELGERSLSGIITGLPLLTKPVGQRVSLVEACLDHAVPGAPLVQFTYALQPPVPASLGSYDVRRASRVLLNFPPATVWVYSRATS